MDYHLPPEVPRERMWTRIEAARAARARRRRQGRRLWSAGFAVAAGLALVVVIGRPHQPVSPTLPTSEFSQLAAARLFTRAEVLLTDPRVPDSSQRAGAMLTQTRLLLDSEAADDPAIKALLQELELVLARLATADVGDVRDDIKNRLRMAATGV